MQEREGLSLVKKSHYICPGLWIDVLSKLKTPFLSKGCGRKEVCEVVKN